MRESVASKLMLALYRARRHADALAVYLRTSGMLRDELELEPSPALQDRSARSYAMTRRSNRSTTSCARTTDASATDAHPVPRPRTRAGEATAHRSGSDARLLTLTGAGGSGKTRLALRVAEALASTTAYRDGARFVSFAEIVDPELIASTICQALELAEQAEFAPSQRLTGWLRRRELLLVLDTAGQPRAAHRLAPQCLVSSSQVAPGWLLLATSREPPPRGSPVFAVEEFSIHGRVQKPGAENEHCLGGPAARLRRSWLC